MCTTNKPDYDYVLSSSKTYLIAERSTLDKGIPQITFSWVHIKFANKQTFTADSIARMVTPFYTPVQLQLNTKISSQGYSCVASDNPW